MSCKLNGPVAEVKTCKLRDRMPQIIGPINLQCTILSHCDTAGDIPGDTASDTAGP